MSGAVPVTRFAIRRPDAALLKRLGVLGYRVYRLAGAIEVDVPTGAIAGFTREFQEAWKPVMVKWCE